MATFVAHIDGFNLYHGLRHRYGYRYLWLDLVMLVARLRPGDELIEVRYYTAMVRDDPAAESRQNTYLAAIDAAGKGRLRVVKGRYQAKSNTCRVCGSNWTGYEEKETDVNIAVSLVADAASARSEMALLITADSDLCPAIRTARDLAKQSGARYGITVAFPPKRNSSAIKRLVPGAFTISHADIRNSLLPDRVRDTATGRIFERPAKWR